MSFWVKPCQNGILKYRDENSPNQEFKFSVFILNTYLGTYNTLEDAVNFWMTTKDTTPNIYQYFKDAEQWVIEEIDYE